MLSQGVIYVVSFPQMSVILLFLYMLDSESSQGLYFNPDKWP